MLRRELVACLSGQGLLQQGPLCGPPLVGQAERQAPRVLSLSVQRAKARAGGLRLTWAQAQVQELWPQMWFRVEV